MIPIRGLYEAVIRVKDLTKSGAFYRDTLGFEIGLRLERRGWLFLRVNGQAGMLVLQEDKGNWPAQHLAFRVDGKDLEASAGELTRLGVPVRGPVYHEWMPAKSIYFLDPDGHELELCAPAAGGHLP